MENFKVLLVCGTRTIKDMAFVWTTVEKVWLNNDFDLLLEGGAEGVDEDSGMWADFHKINHMKLHPQWKKYGKAAGVIRNSVMVEICTKGIALWDGKSKGTKDTIDKLRKANKLLEVIEYDR